MKNIPKPVLFIGGGCAALFLLVVCGAAAWFLIFSSRVATQIAEPLECTTVAMATFTDEWNSSCRPDSPPDPDDIMDCDLPLETQNELAERLEVRLEECYE